MAWAEYHQELGSLAARIGLAEVAPGSTWGSGLVVHRAVDQDTAVACTADQAEDIAGLVEDKLQDRAGHLGKAVQAAAADRGHLCSACETDLPDSAYC